MFEAIIDKTVARRREHDMGVMTLFGDAAEAGGMAYDDRPEIPDLEFDKRDRLAFEKEMLGLYVSDHPLMGAEAALRRRTDGTLADAAEAEEGTDQVLRRRDHVAQPEVDPGRRPHGRVRARGPPGRRWRSWSSRRRCRSSATSWPTTPWSS